MTVTAAMATAWAVWTPDGVWIRGDRVAGPGERSLELAPWADAPRLIEIHSRARRPPPQVATVVQLAHRLLSSRLTLKGAAVSRAQTDLLLGTSRGSEGVDREFWEGIRRRGSGHGSPSAFVYTLPTAAPAEVTLALGLRGSLCTVTAGEASGLTAVARATAHLAAGRSEAVVCGSMELSTPPHLALFLLERVSASTGCCPRLENPELGWKAPRSDARLAGAAETLLGLATALTRAETEGKPGTAACASTGGHWASLQIAPPAVR